MTKFYKGILVLFASLSALISHAQLMPVSVSGFNKDVIADGTAGALASTNVTTGFDQVGYSFVAQNFTGSPTCALPLNRTITSAVTTGLSYQFADYTQNNCLYFTANNAASTLTFDTYRSASTVYVLGTTGSGSSTANITVNFFDGSSQTFTGLSFPDWFNTAGAYNQTGRVNVNTNGLECSTLGPNLAQVALTLNASNILKPITGITVTRASATGASTALGIFAVSINFTGVTLSNSNPYLVAPIANFAYDMGIDTVWANSPYAFVNTSTGDSASYWRINPSTSATNCISGFGCYNQVGETRNFRATFSDTGTYLVTLVVRNRSGRDSLSKWIYVGYPTKKPKANFFLDKQIIGVSEQIPVYDLSENGPTNWQWTVNPYCIGCATDPNAYPNDFLPSASTQLPLLRARDAGKFDVCLKVWNNIGSDSVCKKEHIEVIGGLSMCASAADTIGTRPEGYVYDNGGPVQPYFPNIMGNCYYTIDPCASSVTAYLERFKLRNQDSIIFRNGGPTGPIIRKLGGGNLPDTLKTITANTGRLYMQWQLGAPQNATVGDSGIVIRWTSTPATYSAPNALFTCNDTAYSGQRINYTNASVGQGSVSYNWDVNGDGIYNDHNAPDGAGFTFTTVAPLLKDICVRVSNCKGTSVYCKRIIVLPIQARPLVNFSSPRPAGFTTDTFSLVDLSKNGPNKWTWTITPKNVIWVTGFDSSSQSPKFMLTLPGKYAVKLKAQNVFGVDSAEKFMFLDVLAYNQPSTDFPIAAASDVGISRVVFDNIDTSTALKTPTYSPIYLVKRAVVYRGVTYKVNMMRESGVTPMERKAWIDFNFDADFIDAGEQIYSESAATNPVAEASFTVPANITPGRITRLRIGVSDGGTQLTPDMARSGCFEDYGVEIGLDGVPPTIELKGEAVVRVQRNTTYTDPGVLAIDNREGDISARYETTNNINMAQVGVYRARYWVKDLYGNISDTIERTIQVELNQVGPTVTLNGADTIYLQVRAQAYTELGATAIDNVGNNITNRIKVIGMVDTATIGTYYVNYSVNDAFGFTGEKTRVIIVRKTLPPVITSLDGTGKYKHQIFTPYTIGLGITKKDDYYQPDQITLTMSGSVNVNIPGSYILQYVACDPLSNCSAPYLLQVDVQDTVAPVVSLLGDNPLVIDVYNDNYQDPGVSAQDNYYSSTSLIYITDNQVNPNKLGTYTITYLVKDGSGNEGKLTREVQVVDRIAPSLQILGGNPFDLAWMDTFNLVEELLITDNYYGAEVLAPMVEKTTTLTVDPASGKYVGAERGWREITYQVTDPSGNKSARVRRTVFVEFRTGLNEVNKTNHIQVYPNPSNGKFTIEVGQAITGNANVVIYNVLGAKVFDGQVVFNGTNADVHAQDLKTGMYLMQVTTNGNTFTQKITIK